MLPLLAVFFILFLYFWPIVSNLQAIQEQVMESHILFIAEVSVGKYMVKCLRNLRGPEFCMVVSSWSAL